MRILISLLFAFCFGCESVESFTNKIVKPQHDEQTAIYADVAGYWLCSQPSKSDLILPVPPKPDIPAQSMLPVPETAPVKVMQSATPQSNIPKIVCENGTCTVQKNAIPPEIAKVTPSQQPARAIHPEKNSTQYQPVQVEFFNPCHQQQSAVTYHYKARPRGIFRR